MTRSISFSRPMTADDLAELAQARILGEIPAEQVKDGRHGLRQFRRFPGRRWFLAVVAVCQLDDLLARPGAVLPHGELADFLRSGWPSTVR